MGEINFESMSLDELWELHEKLAKALADRLTSEKVMLEARLKQLQHQPGSGVRLGARRSAAKEERRPYPAVVPKYRNPQDPHETWSGRGRQPRWLVALLQAGRNMDDFLIPPEAQSQPSNVTRIQSAERGVQDGTKSKKL